jgi:hypothetical protein
MLEILGIAVFVIVLLIGLLMVPFGLPGTFLIVADAAVYGLVTHWARVNLALVLVLLGAAIAGEVLEQIISVRGAARYGGGRAGMWGAFIGGIIGVFVGTPMPIIGNVIGAFIGAFLGALVAEWAVRGELAVALRAACGAFVGRVGAAVIKFALAAIMAAVLLLEAFAR